MRRLSSRVARNSIRSFRAAAPAIFAFLVSNNTIQIYHVLTLLARCAKRPFACYPRRLAPCKMSNGARLFSSFNNTYVAPAPPSAGRALVNANTCPPIAPCESHLANRGDDELLERFLGGALDHAVHIEMRLHGELAKAKLRHESRVQSDAVSLEVFVRLGDIEGRLSRHQVRQLRDYLRVLIDDRVSHWRFERDPRPAIAFAIERAHALERAAQERLVVEQLVMQVLT